MPTVVLTDEDEPLIGGLKGIASMIVLAGAGDSSKTLTILGQAKRLLEIYVETLVLSRHKLTGDSHEIH